MAFKEKLQLPSSRRLSEPTRGNIMIYEIAVLPVYKHQVERFRKHLPRWFHCFAVRRVTLATCLHKASKRLSTST